ncbi:MAG: hypothetical protein ABIE43_02135 [Patescibacteria group bacterium]
MLIKNTLNPEEKMKKIYSFTPFLILILAIFLLYSGIDEFKTFAEIGGSGPAKSWGLGLFPLLSGATIIVISARKAVNSIFN